MLSVPAVQSEGTLARILEIQEKLGLIEKHKREHSDEPRDSCSYCQKRRHFSETPQQHKVLKLKKIKTTFEIQRSVQASAKNGHFVSVPKTWAGKNVKVTLLD
jgi:hypothetical protein